MEKFRNESHPEEAWSHQTIFQRACAVRNQQWNCQEYGIPIDLELRTQLKTQIEQKGGVEKINAWLEENDPGHRILRDIENMDWSWLEE